MSDDPIRTYLEAHGYREVEPVTPGWRTFTNDRSRWAAVIPEMTWEQAKLALLRGPGIVQRGVLQAPRPIITAGGEVSLLEAIDLARERIRATPASVFLEAGQ